MKTTELIGPTLDWAVAKAADIAAQVETQHDWSQGEVDYVEFCPSTDWAQGGPIIEREGIALIKQTEDRWVAEISLGCSDPYHARSHAPTPLVAAMRCFVASKLGDEVDVPEELLPTQLDADKARLAQARRAFDQNPTPPLSTIIRRLAASIARQEKAK